MECGVYGTRDASAVTRARETTKQWEKNSKARYRCYLLLPGKRMGIKGCSGERHINAKKKKIFLVFENINPFLAGSGIEHEEWWGEERLEKPKWTGPLRSSCATVGYEDMNHWSILGEDRRKTRIKDRSMAEKWQLKNLPIIVIVFYLHLRFLS